MRRRRCIYSTREWISLSLYKLAVHYSFQSPSENQVLLFILKHFLVRIWSQLRLILNSCLCIIYDTTIRYSTSVDKDNWGKTALLITWKYNFVAGWRKWLRHLNLGFVVLCLSTKRGCLLDLPLSHISMTPLDPFIGI